MAQGAGFDVKVIILYEGKDPADLIQEDPKVWKNVLRNSLPAIESFLEKLVIKEKDSRKLGRLIETKLLPLISLVQSAIERSHFVSLVAKRAGIKEDVIWEDLRKVKMPSVGPDNYKTGDENVPGR